MADERMPPLQYAKYEKVFFLYGSVSKMVQPVRPDEWKRLAEEMWSWAIIKVSALVDGYADSTAPPVVETPVQEPVPEPKGPPLKQKQITVKTVAQVKSGERNGAEWILSRITIQTMWRLPRLPDIGIGPEERIRSGMKNLKRGNISTATSGNLRKENREMRRMIFHSERRGNATLQRLIDSYTDTQC